MDCFRLHQGIGRMLHELTLVSRVCFKRNLCEWSGARVELAYYVYSRSTTLILKCGALSPPLHPPRHLHGGNDIAACDAYNSHSWH